MFSHQPPHPLAVDGQALSRQGRLNPRGPIALATGVINALNLARQEHILLGSTGRETVAPGVIATPGLLQDAAHQGNRKIDLLPLD